MRNPTNNEFQWANPLKSAGMASHSAIVYLSGRCSCIGNAAAECPNEDGQQSVAKLLLCAPIKRNMKQAMSDAAPMVRKDLHRVWLQFNNLAK